MGVLKLVEMVVNGAVVDPELRLDSHTTELTRMRVDPEWHGRGVGSALYHELEQRARYDGYDQFVLDTGIGNDVARGFYESLGFQLQQEVSVH